MTPTAMQNYNHGGYDFDDELFQGPPLHMNSPSSRSRPHHYPSPVNTATNGFAIPSPIASPAFSDSFSISGEPRSVPQNTRRPPASKWESANGGFIPYPGNGPALPRPESNSNSNGTRSRPTTPAAFDAHNLIREPQSEPPSRPLTAKSSYSDMRGSDITSAPFENFSRPRKHSIRQPISDTPSRSRPALLPTPSEDGPEMLDYGPPWRPRGPSMCSNVSASTWAPGMSPTTAEFPDSRIPGTRLLKNAGPPPVSATRPQYGFGRTDSSGSAPILGGAVPWSGGEELRSSFRSQLTASTAPGTANTERSSVLTKNSSATSFGDNADAFVDPDEPSLEDVMGMYEQGFEDDIYEQSDAGDDQEEFPLRPSSSYPQPEPVRVNSGTLDDPPDTPDSPMLAKTRLDAEIRQSKMFFSSPAFMASVPHLASTLNASSHLDETNRDSAKSLDTDPSDSSQPTVTSNDPTDRGLGISNNSASRDNSPSPAPTSLYDSRPSSPDPPPRDPSYPESCLPPDVPGPVEPEAPNSRDRYGFKKENTYISLKQYDDWNAGYTEYLSRRKKKWQTYLKEHSLMTENPNRFPPSNAKTKKFVRKGIPPEWRGAAWFYYAGGPAILAKHSGLYGKVLDMKAKRVDVEAIERDLHRTFPDNINFKPPQAPSDADQMNGKPSRNKEQPIIASLRRVLFAFSIYNPHIGYCQSLNFIAGLLLLFVDTEEQCFWLLNVITHLYLPGTHEISLEGSKVDLGVLMTEIRDTMPAVWDKIGGDLEADPQSRPSTSRSFRKPRTRFRRKQTGALPTERLPPITLCMTAWFMSCFIGTLPIETTLRVWDIFFYEGSKTLFRTALAIFKTGEPEIMAVSDPMEMFGVVQTMPRRMLDANGLIDACFKRRNGFSHLSQGVIDERRQERRDQAQLDKDKQSGRSQTLPPSGNVTDAESEVRRKGTLFGRRKRDVSGTRPGRA